MEPVLPSNNNFRINPTNYGYDVTITDRIKLTNRAALAALGCLAATVVVGFTFTATAVVPGAFLTILFAKEYFKELPHLNLAKKQYSDRAEELNHSLDQPGGLDFDELAFFSADGDYQNEKFPKVLKKWLLIQDVGNVDFTTTLKKYDERYYDKNNRRLPLLLEMSQHDPEFKHELCAKWWAYVLSEESKNSQSKYASSNYLKNFSTTFDFGYSEDDLNQLLKDHPRS